MIEAREVFDEKQPLSEVRSFPNLRLVTPEIVDFISETTDETYPGQYKDLQGVRAELDELYEDGSIQRGYN